MYKQAARMWDTHVCPKPDHIGGPIAGPCAPTVLMEGDIAARVSDHVFCLGAMDEIKTGSETVFIAGQAAARKDDTTEHKGAITSGCSTVLIG